MDTDHFVFQSHTGTKKSTLLQTFWERFFSFAEAAISPVSFKENKK